MACGHSCGCASYREHLLSIGVRPVTGSKVTVEHSDQTVNRVTEHWNGRQDVHVQVLEPVMIDKESNA